MIVLTLNDDVYEGNESFTLSGATSSQATPAVGTGTIADHEDNPPKSEDFIVEVSSGNRTQVIFDHESEEKDHISDEEDDAANEQLHVVITELPEHGTLFHNGVEIKEADLYQGEGDTTYTKFDPDLIEYQPDNHSEGFSLGINSNADTQPLGQPDSGSSTSDFYNWGEKVNANTRELKLDGGDIVTIRSEGGKLTQYSGDESANHVGYGLGVGGKQGVNEGEKLIIEFDSRPADSVTLGLDGLGGYFEKDLGNANESSVVITVNYEGGSKTFEFQKESSGNSDLFHSLTIPSEGFDLPENVEITSIELTTEGKGNWELRSVETSLSDSFDYRALDSDGNFSDVSTVTFEETNQAPDAQNDPVGFEVKLGSFNEGSWTSQGAAISANYAGETRLVTEDGDKRGVAGHENGGEEAQLQFNRETGQSEQFVIDLDKPATEFSFTVSNLYKDEGDQAGNHEQGKWVAYLNGVAVASDTFVANDGNHKGEYTVDLTKDGKPIAFDKIVFEATDFVDVSAKGNDSSDYFVTGFQASSEGAYAVNQGGVLEIPISELLANDSDLDGDSIRITYVYGESQGEAYIKDGVVYFDLNGDFVGQTDFQYQITDDRGGFDTASVSVIVNPEPVKVVVESIDLLSNQVVEGDKLAFKVSLDSGALEETRLDIEFGQLGDDASENDVNLTDVVFTNGVKYDKDASELIIPVGVKDFTVLIPTVVDGVHELDEDYSIKVGDVSSSGTIVNAEALNLSVTSLGDVAEGSKAVFSVALTNPSSEAINISLNLALDGSENSAEVEDFKALSELFTAYYLDPQPTGDDLRVEVPVTIDSMTGKPIVEIPAGASEIFIEVATQDDVVFEGSEDFTLVVTDESGYVANNFDSAHSSIVDDGTDPDIDGPQTGNDDRPIVESISSFDVEEGSTGQFIVELSNTSESETTVAMSLNDDSAKGGEDFNVSSVTVVFGSGDDKQVDTVEVIDGKFVVTVPEGLGSFAVEVATIQDEHSDNLEQFSLSGKTSYQEQAESGIATILDNEAPLVDLNGDQSGVDYSSSYVEGDEARLATIDAAVFDDKDTIRTMTITLTNPKEGDDLTWGENSVFTVNKAMIDGEVVLQITHPSGDVSAAEFESFLQSTRFINTSDSPDEEERVIEVLVSDGINTSAPALVSVAVTQEEELSLQNVVGLEDNFIDLGIVIHDAETSVTTVELSGIPQGSTIQIDGQASVVNSADAIVVSIDDISSVKVKAPEHSDVNFDISVVAKDDSNNIVETGSISVDVHPDADKPILNIGGFAQVAAIDFEDVTIKSGSWDSDIEINKVEGAGTVGQWFTSNPGQHVEVGTEGTYLPGNSTNQVMEIEGEVGDKILYTDMDLVAGRFYNFEFDIAARTNKAHTSDMSVTLIKLDDQGDPIDGSEVELYDFDPTTHGWYQGESITLPVEESGKYRLLFEADEADSTGAIMDNIKFTAVDNLGYEDSFIKLSEIDASLQDSLDQSESLKVELTGIPVGSVLKDGEGDSANIYVVTQENKDDRIDVTGWDLSNLQVKAQDAGVFAITVIATSTERDTNKDDEHGDHSDVGGSLTAETTASINVEVRENPTSGEDDNEPPKANDFTVTSDTKFVGFSFQTHATDKEDDESQSDDKTTSVRIESVPTEGSLYYVDDSGNKTLLTKGSVIDDVENVVYELENSPTVSQSFNVNDSDFDSTGLKNNESGAAELKLAGIVISGGVMTNGAFDSSGNEVIKYDHAAHQEGLYVAADRDANGVGDETDLGEYISISAERGYIENATLSLASLNEQFNGNGNNGPASYIDAHLFKDGILVGTEKLTLIETGTHQANATIAFSGVYDEIRLVPESSKNNAGFTLAGVAFETSASHAVEDEFDYIAIDSDGLESGIATVTVTTQSPDFVADDDMIDSVAYRSGYGDFDWQQSAAIANAGKPEQHGQYEYDSNTGISIDVGIGNDKVFLGDGDDTIYLGESHVQEQDGDIPENEFASVLNDFANTALNNLTDTANVQDQALKAESQSKAGLDIGHGGAGDDVIFGEEGSDILFGGTGHDILDGGEGSDAVRGGSGNDILIGGSGDDILIGDDGEDIFKFVDDGTGIRDGEIDTIKDFTKGEDKIDISDLLHTDDSDSIDSLLANNEIGLEADGDNLILTISESDGSASQKVVIEGGSSQYSEFLSDGSLSSADGSAILNDLLKINNDMS
ncbi:Ig-like domain-containing protein [Vibrio owensii]|uniref:Ig-like domain-containing protein n=1 Tax=Vibrio owensii TaxID=696485 RepID=UPI0040677D6D